MEKTISEKITQGFLLLCGLSFLLIGANTFHDPLAAMALNADDKREIDKARAIVNE